MSEKSKREKGNRSEPDPALMASTVAAGFPSPADDHSEERLDLNRLLIKHPAATFFVRTSGDSMLKRGIHDRDLLVVDRSLEPRNGAVVIVALDGELALRELRRSSGRNASGSGGEGRDVEIWGVVTHVIHSL
ncbi:MAG: LexA family protein [Candidatus Zixiibacteriota bacterium]